MAHTEGEWQVLGPHTTWINNHAHDIWQIVSEGTGCAVCLLPHEDDTPQNRTMIAANAQLIAAAPDLLAACNAQSEAIDRLMAMLVVAQEGFMPSKCGQPWDAMVMGHRATSKAVTKVTN